VYIFGEDIVANCTKNRGKNPLSCNNNSEKTNSNIVMLFFSVKQHKNVGFVWKLKIKQQNTKKYKKNY
jgi:hypothetical protein